MASHPGAAETTYVETYELSAGASRVGPRTVSEPLNTPSGSLADLRIDYTRTERRFPWGTVVFVLLLVALGAGTVWWLKRPRPVEVRTMVVREAPATGAARTLLNASGYVVARREATVSSKVTGKVVEVNVEEGMIVPAGQILARLDDTNTAISLRLAEARREAAQAAQGETEARLELAKRELKRTRDLVQGGVAANAEIDPRDAEVKALEARSALQKREVAVVEREVEQCHQQLDDLIIKAPFAGVVTSKSAQAGEIISPVSAGGGYTRTGICTIVDMRSLEIEVDVNESYIQRVTAGQPVTATLDAYPEWQIPAKVIAIIPTANRDKATVKVRVGFEAQDPRVLPQMGVKVAFQAATDAAAVADSARASRVVVARSAVLRRNGDTVVFVVAGNQADRRVVTVEDAGQGDECVVRSGLATGERVIVEAPESLTAGALVQEKR